METLILDMPAWEVFVTVGIILAVAEIFIPGFIVLPIGIGFLLAAPVAALTDSLFIQLVALAVLEVTVFLFLRKYGPSRMKPAVYSNAEGMIGMECEVVEETTASRAGYVKLYGDRWQAKTHNTEPIPAGSRAIITKLEGNKVLIEPLDNTGGKL